MATAYLANRAKQGVFSVGVGDTGPCSVPFTFTIPAALALNDTIKLAKIPANAVLCAVYLSHPDLETGGPTLLVDIGDSAGAQTFVAAGDTTFRSAFDNWMTACTNYVAQSLPKAYTADDYVILKINTAATTSPSSGTIKGFIQYNMNPGNLS